jgi:wyosine [tRNA(Phe)-imidazoG37] synthetase (radical SAM superfamily)
VTSSIIYGPVPSRRLGRSLGINNIPPKKCSYSCVYCQIGKTPRRQIEREVFYEPRDIARQARERTACIRDKGEAIDYLSFVPDGEPTLDTYLDDEIRLLRETGIKIAVITNASLVWREDVRRALHKADWVSIKVDAVSSAAWRRINRPHQQLNLDAIMGGILSFARSFRGELTTETMLIRGINENPREVSRIADFLEKLRPSKAYLAVPTRPPAEKVSPADEESINTAYQIFSERLNDVEYLIGYEGNAFSSTGDIAEDLLGITAVHPMRQEAVTEILARSGADRDVIEGLVKEGRIIKTEYQGNRFYVRKLPLYSGRVTG